MSEREEATWSTFVDWLRAKEDRYVVGETHEPSLTTLDFKSGEKAYIYIERDPGPYGDLHMPCVDLEQP